MLDKNSRPLIVGAGYVGARLAQALRESGVPTDSLSRHSSLSERSINCDLDIDCPRIAHRYVWYTCPPGETGVHDLRLRRFLENWCPQKKMKPRIVYISTTGVYGDHDGAWVDETSELNATSDRALRRIDAEQQIAQGTTTGQFDYIILRVAGIYGPNRLPLERIKQATPMLTAGEAPYSNRIHADDLVRIAIRAISHSSSNQIYNVADGNPSTMPAYFDAVADVAGLPRLPKVSRRDAEKLLSPAMMRYLSESRRVINRKVIEQLQLELGYPTLDEGLRHAWQLTRQSAGSERN